MLQEDAPRRCSKKMLQCIKKKTESFSLIKTEKLSAIIDSTPTVSKRDFSSDSSSQQQQQKKTMMIPNFITLITLIIYH